MTLDTERITVRSTNADITVCITVRADVLSEFQEFDGVGDTLSEALLDLSDQLADAGL